MFEQVYATLLEEIASLRRRMEVQEAIHAIRTLHFKYGYYMDRYLLDEVVTFFSRDCEIHFRGGIFRGVEGAKRLYKGRLGRFGPAPGLLVDHLMMQDIVNIEADGAHASARFRCLVQGGIHESVSGVSADRAQASRQYWHSGLYENRYVREDGVWKILIFNYMTVWEADYDQGWARADPDRIARGQLTVPYPDDPFGPDAIETQPRGWPDVETFSFHYPHPVTGEKWSGGQGVKMP